MNTKTMRPVSHGRRIPWARVLWFAIGFLLIGTELFAQNYEITINQRRLGHKVGVEFWIKSLNGSAPNLGNASISVVYNTDQLQPEGTTAYSATNITAQDVDQATPFQAVTSPFSQAANGYSTPTAQAADAIDGGGTHAYVYQLDINLDAAGVGFQPATTGDGSFLGMLKFDLVNFGDLDDADLSAVAFNPYTFVGNIEIFDADGTSQKANTTLSNPADFAIRGITILNPNGPNQAVNRYPDPAYASLSPNHGYPVYFERSGLEDPSGGNYGTNRFAYLLEYSLDGGSVWTEIGRVAETVSGDAVLTGAGTLANHVSGEIDYLDVANDEYITQGDGAALTVGYGDVLRVIWESNINFPYRSEQAKLKITQLETSGTGAAITERNAQVGTGRYDESDATFVLGRLFFVQLDGTSGYFRTQNNYSNATQLTVTAWVNLNGIQAGTGVETGIVASAAGAVSPEEGAWMLYLKDGSYPAFRAREIEGRGTNGYIADIASFEPLTTASDASPIQDSHADNWTHLAATVANNIVTLYVNGEIVAQEINNQAVNIRMMTSIHPIWIGVNPNGGIEASDYLHAGVKEVHVWRVALTQDQLRTHIPGIYDPTGAISAIDPVNNDERAGLELDYTLQGARLDIASEVSFQNSANPLNYYEDPSLTASSVNSLINYRPDRSHLKLTSPVGDEGVWVLEDQSYSVRWAAYGIGSTAPASQDIQIMWSRNNGALWVDALDDQAMSLPLDQVEVEAGQAMWEPFNSITVAGQDDDLQGVVPIDANYAKAVKVKISGTEARGQDNIYDTSEDFTVAPYFALKNLGTSIISVPGTTSLNLSGAIGFIEAWIKPYRFPTTEEGFFPIVSKTDSTTAGNFHYSLHLTSTGQLEFKVGSSTGDAVRTALSDATLPLIEPNVIEMDSAWTHVGVWVNLANGGQSSIRFFIDGVVQGSDAISLQLGDNITVDNFNEYPTYLGYEPGTIPDDSRSFIGELKEVRFWGNNPAGQNNSGSEPTALTKFIQGASSVRADELGLFGGTDYSQYLLAAFTMNGGSWINNGFTESIGAYPTSSNLTAHIRGARDAAYEATKPYLKLVEPVYKQAVPNTQTDLKVRWVGFDFNRNTATTFRTGSDGTNHADMEYSVLGGGGLVIQPYQNVASETYSASYSNAMTLPSANSTYEFPGTMTNSQFASQLDVSNTDPDLNNDGIYNDQREIAATMTNGRLRLKGRATINGITLEYENGGNGDVPSLRTESPLFNITPPSNFTVRVMLEGHHDKRVIQNDIGSSYDARGLQIKLYTNNANTPGVLVNTSESSVGYSNDATALDPTAGTGRGNDGSQYANVPFVFTELSDGRYFVVVEHLNHLPIMSKYAAPFYYAGDDETSWDIESGWDFQNWDGVANNIITEAEASVNPPTIGSKYTAYGNAEVDQNLSAWAGTALNYTDGQPSTAAGQIGAMSAGDCYKDGQINAADRVLVRADASGYANRSDVTGDGFVNATDRTIVDRNNNKVSSLTSLSQLSGNENDENPVPILPYLSTADPMTVVHPDYPEESQRLIDAAQRHLDRGGKKVHTSLYKNELNDVILSGGLKYRVKANVIKNDEYIEVTVYMRNEGAEFALGNATFGVQYDPSSLRFEELMKQEEVAFSDRPDMGYGSLYSAPTNDTRDPFSNLRSIEVDYDAYAELSGQIVPEQYTYLGTLRFKIMFDQEVYEFSWHDITAIHSTSGEIITGSGVFEPIDGLFVPKGTMVTVPNGGESWRAGRLYTITWTKPSEDIPLLVEFSIDNGATWERIANSAVNSSAMTFNWKSPRVKSSECLIRLINAETGVEVDRSDANFSLIPAPAEIVRPAASDPIYRGGKADLIKWALDDQTNIRFEFSENGVNGWSPITAVVNSQTGQVDWVLPAVNTKNAAVRMVSIETGEIMTISENFKILAGAVNITSPRAGDVITSKKAIRWTYDNVSRFDMQLSLDGGQTWEGLVRDVNAVGKSYDWMIPNVNTKQAIIRAIWNNDPDMEYDRTPEFEIKGLTSVEDLEEDGFALQRPIPNPFSGETKIRFTLPKEELVTITVFSSAGMKIMTLAQGQSFAAGTHTLRMKANNLPAGMYFIHMTAGAYMKVREAVHVK